MIIAIVLSIALATGPVSLDQLKSSIGITVPVVVTSKVLKECPLRIKLRHPERSGYICNGKIYVGSKAAQGPTGSLAFILAHEQGHYVVGFNNGSYFQDEQVADCYAGETLRRLVYEKVISKEDYQRALKRAESGHSRIHGTSKQRKRAFLGIAKICRTVV